MFALEATRLLQGNLGPRAALTTTRFLQVNLNHELMQHDMFTSNSEGLTLKVRGDEWATYDTVRAAGSVEWAPGQTIIPGPLHNKDLKKNIMRFSIDVNTCLFCV
jgi:hypothetical protein